MSADKPELDSTEPGNPDNTGEYPGEAELDYQQMNRVGRGKEYDDTNG